MKIISAVFCLLCGSTGLDQAGGPKPLTETELEKELAVVQSYLGIQPAKLAAQHNAGEYWAAHAAVGKVLKHIGHLPEGCGMRLQAIALARKYAAVTDHAGAIQPGQKGPDKTDYRQHLQSHLGLAFAWGVLRKTQVLHDGMRLEELVALLAQPTRTYPQYVEWYYSSSMHVNPCLRYWKVDGRMKKGAIEVEGPEFVASADGHRQTAMWPIKEHQWTPESRRHLSM